MGLADRRMIELGVRDAGWIKGGLEPIGDRGGCEKSKSSLRIVGLGSTHVLGNFPHSSNPTASRNRTRLRSKNRSGGFLVGSHLVD